MNERRLARLQEQIKQRLAEVLQRDLADPKLGLVTITRIELDSEFTQCRAYWSVMARVDPAKEQRSAAATAVRAAEGRVASASASSARSLHTRTIPHLEFVFDEGIARRDPHQPAAARS
jgi:ribosome-binding factor A